MSEQKYAHHAGFRVVDITGLDEARAVHRRPLDPAVAAAGVGFRCVIPLAHATTSGS